MIAGIERFIATAIRFVRIEPEAPTIIPATTVSGAPAAGVYPLTGAGSTHRINMARLLKGNIAERVSSQLPENIELIIHG